MTTFDLLVRAGELVLIRHGVAEADLENSFDLALAVKENSDDSEAVAAAIEKFVTDCGGDSKDGTLDDADFLTDLAKAMN